MAPLRAIDNEPEHTRESRNFRSRAFTWPTRYPDATFTAHISGLLTEALPEHDSEK